MERLGLFARRTVGYFADCLVILVYAVLLAAISITVAPDAELSKGAAYGLSVVTLTGPVVLVFALAEARFGASPGKALLGLRVRHGAERPGFARSLVRNIGKFLPWEIAHLGIWLTPGQPFVDPPGALSVWFWAASGALIAVQAVLVLAFKAGLHDGLSGLRVVRAR